MVLASRTRTFQAHELCGIQLLLVLRCNLRAYHPRRVDLSVLGRLHALTAAMQPSKELARGVSPPAGWYRLQTSIPGSVCQGLRVVAFSSFKPLFTRLNQTLPETLPYQTLPDPTGPYWTRRATRRDNYSALAGWDDNLFINPYVLSHDWAA